MAKAAREYHLIDLAVGISHGGFESLAGARQFARQEGLPAWDIFHGNDRIEYHDGRRRPAKPRSFIQQWECCSPRAKGTGACLAGPAPLSFSGGAQRARQARMPSPRTGAN